MKKGGGFMGYMGEEDRLNNALYKFVGYQWPKAVIFHVPNEGKRTPFEISKAKFLGMRAGVSDLFIFYKGRVLIIEVKAFKGRLTDTQRKFIEDMSANSFTVIVVNNIDKGMGKIEDWFNTGEK